MISAQELREMQSKEEHPHKKIVEAAFNKAIEAKSYQYISKCITIDLDVAQSVRNWLNELGYNTKTVKDEAPNGMPVTFTEITW